MWNDSPKIITSKLVASGTESGTNLFELKYFDRVVYLAQSPQFYKEHGVAGFERVYETGHVYRAEPHAVRLYWRAGGCYSAGARAPYPYLRYAEYGDGGKARVHRAEPLPSMLAVPCWEFSNCLERLCTHFHRNDLTDDLDPEADRQLYQLAQRETGIPAVFRRRLPIDRASRPPRSRRCGQ